jgi:hypothetical protein
MSGPSQLPPYQGGNDMNQPRQNESNLFSILAIVFGAIAVIFFPIIFGLAAIVLAVVARNKRERLANIALIVAIVGTVAGFVLGAIVYSNMG